MSKATQPAKQENKHAVGDTATLWTVTSFYPHNAPEADEYTLKPCQAHGVAVAWYGREQPWRFIPAHADGTPKSPYCFLSQADATAWRIAELTNRLRVAEAQLAEATAERERLLAHATATEVASA